MALVVTLYHCMELADSYNVARYFLLALLCLSFSLTQTPKQGRLSIVGLVYFIALTFFAVWSLSPVAILGKKMSFFGGVLPVSLVGIVYSYSIGENWEKVADAFIVACVIAALGAYLGYEPHGAFFGERAYAFVGSPVWLAGTLACCIPLLMGRGTARAMAIPLVVAAIFLTQSRSGLLAAAVGALGYFFMRGYVSLKGFLVLCIIALAITASMFSGLRGTKLSDRGRYHMTRTALVTAYNHPLGIGPDRFGWAMATYRDKALNDEMGDRWMNSHTHNHLLEALVTGGPIFLLVHLALLGAIGLFLLRARNPQVFGLCLALCAFGLTQPTPLALKALLASFLACLDPYPVEIPGAKPWFTAFALAAFLASLGAVTGAKLYANGQNHSLGEMMADSFEYLPGSLGER